MTATRLKKDERKKIIQNISKQVFLKKEFKNTTMQDIINATGMSIGGIYHHYKNTSEILYDIMENGNKYRENIIFEKIHNEDIITNKLIANLIVNKMLADNEYIPLYAMFLQQVKEDTTLKILFEKLIENSKHNLKNLFEKINYPITLDNEEFKFIIHIINSVILGCELLDVRETFIKNSEYLKQMIELFLEQSYKKKYKN